MIFKLLGISLLVAIWWKTDLGVVNPVLVVALIFWLSKCFKNVPHGKAVVAEYNGFYYKTMKPGLHFLFYPFVYQKEINWVYRDENNVKKSIVRSSLPTGECTVDSIIVKCADFSIDALITYKIDDYKELVYNNNDPLTVFRETICNTMMKEANKLTEDELRRDIDAYEVLVLKKLSKSIVGLKLVKILLKQINKNV